MKPEADASGTAQAGRHRRGVRIFVALHLAAVGTLYAAAVTVGGGFAGPPMPPIAHARASPPALPAAPALAPAAPERHAATPAFPPDWTRRAEIAAPWESH